MSSVHSPLQGTGKTQAVRAVVGAASKMQRSVTFFSRRGADCLVRIRAPAMIFQHRACVNRSCTWTAVPIESNAVHAVHRAIPSSFALYAATCPIARPPENALRASSPEKPSARSACCSMRLRSTRRQSSSLTRSMAWCPFGERAKGTRTRSTQAWWRLSWRSWTD